MRRIVCLLWFLQSTVIYALPNGFVYLSEVDPSISQDMRYYGSNNFIGRSIAGYQRPVCILSAKAAAALAQVQRQARKYGYSLKVYDCYRPQPAVNDFWHWSQQPSQQQQKAIFYPREPKAELFAKGYIADKSGHSRGSTVDLTLVPLHSKARTYPKPSSCYGDPRHWRVDNSIDMGTAFDCMDPTAHLHYPYLRSDQKNNRRLLKQWMLQQGFQSYWAEWWHYTLRPEPYPHQYFDFPVR